MLGKFTIAKKLFLSFSAVLLIIFSLMFGVWRSLSDIDANVDLNVHTYNVIDDARTMMAGLINIQTGLRGYAMTGDTAFLEPLELGTNDYTRMRIALNELVSDNPVQLQRIADIHQQYQSWMSEDVEPLRALTLQVSQGLAEQSQITARVAEATEKEKMDAMKDLVVNVIREEQSLLDERRTTMTASQDFALLILVAGGLIAAILAVVIALSLSRNIATRLGNMVTAARQIADGKLNTRVPSDGSDEVADLGKAFNDMQERLRNMIQAITQGSEQLLGASEQISSASNQLSVATSEQAQSAGAMAATVEQLTVSISSVAENAKEAHSISSDAGLRSEQGGEVIQRTLESMQRIADTVQTSARQIGQLEQVSEQITSIVRVIQEIADQTNLLALNAAIEAARAGEQGRGFAVVADEVRLLAQRTSSSTQEIADMVNKIQQGTQDAVSHMNVGVEQVNSGVLLAGQAGEAIVEIREGASRVVSVVNQISSALREQDNASQDVARNVERIAHMSEENDQAVSETTRAAVELQKLAQELRAQVSQFSL
ncbi:MAG: methyl-accepting chemotaxis protein [Pseudohongiella sp.]|uniref:methyl-accepting chemotaxis protein n=1 Tax=Pseudohongiella sp. TaxID=1979412 RepID=UPI0034A010EF